MWAMEAEAMGARGGGAAALPPALLQEEGRPPAQPQSEVEASLIRPLQLLRTVARRGDLVRLRVRVSG